MMESEEIKKILNCDTIAAAKLMTRIENESPTAVEELSEIYAHTGHAWVVGITGPGGVGKSTLIDALLAVFLRNNLDIGVVATDPSSPISGGALLGDRIRLRRCSTDKGVFFRSMASRGWRGGLAKAVIGIIHVMDAMGKDIILVETAGTGQSDIDIAKVADTCVLLLMPGMGDEIQAMKAGILEIADIFAINKADLPGAEIIRHQIEQMLAWRHYPTGSWRPDVVLTNAVDGTGVEQLAEKILKHKDYLISSELLMEHRRRNARLELSWLLETHIKQQVYDWMEDKQWDKLIDKLARRTVEPYSIARNIAKQLMKEAGQIHIAPE